MRLPWRKRESESTASSVALVVIELPADELLGGEPAVEPLQAEPPGRATRLLARSRQLARRLNPARPARIASGKSGSAAKSVVVKLHPRRLAKAVREFRRIGSADLPRLASGVGRGVKNVGGRLSFISPRKARSVRVVTTTIRRLVWDIDPSAATRVARETAQLARTAIAKLDPSLVEDAVRRFVATIDKPGRGTRLARVARIAVNKIGSERAVNVAAEVTRALKRLVDRLDPDQVGKVIGELVAAVKSANNKEGSPGSRRVPCLASRRGRTGSQESRPRCRVARCRRGGTGRAYHSSQTSDCCRRKRQRSPFAHVAAHDPRWGIAGAWKWPNVREGAWLAGHGLHM